ncbi:hypothetical protein BB559_000919 [Furculomyces boomerangus]|uniref:Uncharacterized protein n=2 Tax=Harpellales TaxID=61421 RepID=A0A2T9Z3L8_9FUNG|nr:hypothetical protein BB559_000919 [Furculomyces boomerangus]PVZ96785.1 hypothetical protein BB558_007292 [Smittium angustum]PVZ98316.1 hypothetical protein BB558_005679 [Smittium angustum]
MKHQLPTPENLRGILKKSNLKSEKNEKNEKSAQLKWDEENIRITELQKDSKMKIDEPPTPYIRYDMENDPELQNLDDDWNKMRLSPRNSSRASSVSSSPKKAKFDVPMDDWDSDSDSDNVIADDKSASSKEAKMSKFEMMRNKHYSNEGIFVKKVSPLKGVNPTNENFWGFQNGKFVVKKTFSKSNNDIEMSDNDISEIEEFSNSEDIDYEQSSDSNNNQTINQKPTKLEHRSSIMKQNKNDGTVTECKKTIEKLKQRKNKSITTKSFKDTYAADQEEDDI